MFDWRSWLAGAERPSQSAGAVTGINISSGLAGESPGSDTGSALEDERRIELDSCSLALDSASLEAAAAFVSAVTSGRPAFPPVQHRLCASVMPPARGLGSPGAASSSPSSTASSTLRLKLSQLTIGVDIGQSGSCTASAADLEHSSFSSVTQPVRFLCSGNRVFAHTKSSF